jgi:hypothetical protein
MLYNPGWKITHKISQYREAKALKKEQLSGTVDLFIL